MIAAENGDLPRFYERVRALAALPRAQRDQLWADDDGGAAAGAPARPDKG
jgi:predicted aminopeptidase